MGQISYFQFIPSLIYLVFSAGFLAFLLHERTDLVPRLLALSYLSGSAAMVLHILAGHLHPAFGVYLENILYLVASVSLTAALYVRAEKRPPLLLFLMAGLFLLVGQSWYFWVTPSLTERIVITYAANGFVLAMALFPLWKTRKVAINRVLFAIMAIFSGQFLARAFVATFIYREMLTSETYLSSWSAAATHFVNSIAALALATALFIALGMKVVSELQHRSNTDDLSRLLNRRGFIDTAIKILSGLRRSDKAVLVLADLDDFKQINDKFGHAAGDAVIRSFGEILARGTRSGDVVGRIGGEEFSVLLPNCTMREARGVIEALRKEFSVATVEGLSSDHRVSASFGLAEWQDGPGWSILYERADKALYAAKQRGKNCLVSHGQATKPVHGTLPYLKNRLAATKG